MASGRVLHQSTAVAPFNHLSMNPTLPLVLFILFLSTGLQAQSDELDSLDRDGKIWLDGSPDINGSIDQLRAGYFFTDRLLVGSSLSVVGDDDVYLTPFARYYLGGAGRTWRPYGEAGLQLALGRFAIENKYVALGLERTFNTSTLLNLELRYTNLNGRRNDYTARGSLNTLLGGPAWRTAAEQHFRAGALVVGSQLFEASVGGANAFSFNYVNLSPSVDYFVTDRLAVQARLDLARTAFDQSLGSLDDKYTSRSAELRGGARYYLTTKSLFNLFVEGGMTYRSRYQDSQLSGTRVQRSTHGLRADLGLGASVFINRNTSVDFGVNLNQELLNGGDLFADGFLRLKFWF